MDTINYYIKRGVKKENFTPACGKLHPIKTVPLDKEPKFKTIDNKYKVPECISNTPQYLGALKDAVNSIKYDEPISHYDHEEKGKIIVRPMPYSVRTALISYADKPYAGYTLREVIFPHPFSINGEFEGLNLYPYPKPIGVNIFLFDQENRLILQRRANLHFDGNTYSATAAGGIEYNVMKNYNNPLREIIKRELEEEIYYTGKIDGLQILGYIINYKYILDVSFIYVGWATEEIQNNVKNDEVTEIIRINPKELCKLKNVSTIIPGFVKLLNTSETLK